MARTVKEPDVRRNEILDVAQQLFYTKGYEQTSVQDIVDQVGIAKGTFYHYFGSKVALLNELIERLADQAMVVVAPVVSNGDLDAATKFLQLFDTIASWKAQSRTFLLDVLRPFFGDDNAVLRLKLQAAALARFVPLVTQVIRQGVAEGLFHTPYPDDIGEIVVLILTSLSEGLVVLILQEDPDVDLLPVAASRLEVSQHAIERLLGAASGSLPVMELDDLRPWFAQTRPS